MADNGGVCGIGVNIIGTYNNIGAYVFAVGPDTPAERNSLHPGDVILQSRETQGPNEPAATWRPVTKDGEGLQGPAGTHIDIQVLDDKSKTIRELDGVTRSGIDRATLKPDNGICGIPVSEGDSVQPGNTPPLTGRLTRTPSKGGSLG